MSLSSEVPVHYQTYIYHEIKMMGILGVEC